MHRKVQISRSVSVHIQVFGSRLPGVPLVFLHGFASSGKDFSEVIRKMKIRRPVYVLDIPGFGASVVPFRKRYFESPFLVSCLESVLKKLGLKKIILSGYSMGGRLALAYTCEHPSRVHSLILESSSPGLKTVNERKERLKADKQFAKTIRKNGIEYFVRQWGSLPLFASQKKMSPAKKRYRTAQLRRNSISALALSVVGFGQGNMPSYWGRLKKIKSPVLLISGSEDTKYTAVMREMNAKIPDSRIEIVPDAGHNVHLEKPDNFVKLLRSFCEK